MDKFKDRDDLNFKVYIFGRGTNKIKLKDRRLVLQEKYIIDYEQIFIGMENSDFYLPLLSPDIPEHLRYTTSGVTGSYQLITTFLKPPIIHRHFARFYNFNTNNAILYDDDADLCKKILEAINIPEYKYELMQNNLKDMNTLLCRQSISNLEHVFISVSITY